MAVFVHDIELEKSWSKSMRRQEKFKHTAILHGNEAGDSSLNSGLCAIFFDAGMTLCWTSTQI